MADHAAQRPDKVALRVSAGAAEPGRFEEWSFGALHAAVLALSAQLQERAPAGERALILLPSGERFVVAFLACLHAGLVAVPAYPPRRNRHRERVVGIHDHAAPALILTTATAEPLVHETLPATVAPVLALDDFGLRELVPALGGAGLPAGMDPDGEHPAPASKLAATAKREQVPAVQSAPRHHADDIAFLQFTSGSTSVPKGTVITHANLLANLAAIQSVFAHEPEHEFVTWLPPFHDMGLVGGILTPIFRGMTSTLLTPEEFLRAPLLWLQVITARAALVTGGAPNFAYHLLATRITDAELAGLDLSRWRIAFNGAEPIRPETVERFTARFASCGFRPEAWLPCYGLAESTLLAAGRRGRIASRASEPRNGRAASPKVPNSGAGSGGGAVPFFAAEACAGRASASTVPPPLPTPEAGTLGEPSLPQSGDASGVLHLDRTEIEQGRVALADAGSAASLVSCGPPALDTRLSIHDPDTGAALDADRIGEIWIESPSVARGYWRDPPATAAAFPSEGVLRTGDLGFLHAGELYVTGRVKDLIIIRGRNLHPHDLEAAVAAQLPGAGGANSIAAFELTRDGAGSGALGLLLEAPRTWVPALRRAAQGEASDEITRRLQSIRQAVTEAFEVTPELIAFVAPGDFPRTSSGKVQRRAARAGLLDGTLPVLYVDRLGSGDGAADSRLPQPTRAGGASSPGEAAGSAHEPMPAASPPNVCASGASDLDRQPGGSRSAAAADALILWLRDFARRRLNSQFMDERRTVTPHVVLEFGNRGLFGLEIPRALGGLGLTTCDACRVLEQLAAIDLTLALLVGAHNGLGLFSIQRHGTDALRAELVPAMAAGRHLSSFAATELSAGSNPKTITTVATRGSDGVWVLNGRKQWIGTASWAGTLTVIAKARAASGESLGSIALAVPSDAEGVSFGPEAMTMGMRGIPQLPVFFENVRVEGSRVLGEVGRGFDVAFEAMRRARVGLAVFSLGAMKRCLQLMATFAGQREVAGGRLADLPATQDRLRETVCAIAAVETLVRTVAAWLDAGEALPEEIYLVCKTTAPELLGETADRALQMLGARGYTDNNGLTQLFRDARIIRIFEGPTEALNASLGARLRRESDLLCDWLAQRPRGAEGARVLRALAEEHPTANDVALGELASWTFLRWLMQTSADAAAGETLEWIEHRLERLRHAVCAPSKSVIAVAELSARLREQIGACVQTLPGEDRELDALLRSEPTRSGDLQSPTSAPRSAAAHSLGEAEESEALHAQVGSAIANRRSVGADSLVARLERGLLAFLEREKLGRMTAIPHDATFSSLGIDSLAAAQLALEIEKEFAIRINEETLYDYPTLAALAGYLEGRLVAHDGSAAQGTWLWQQTMQHLNERMHRLKRSGQYFYEVPIDAQDSASAVVEGKRCVHLSSYSYLGFVGDSEVRERVQASVNEIGCGSHGVRMLNTGRWHKELEARIATMLHAEDCITFGTGFVTNWAVISALMQPEDTVLADEWIHASLVDGCRASGAKFTLFRHNDLEQLAALLAAPTRGKTLVVVDAVYSMEGDIAPLPQLSALAHAHGAWLMVDEAHSLGVLGARGLGIQEHFGLAPDAIDIKMGTLSKTIPSSGGYIAGSAELVSALRHNVRSYIFSSAPTPPQVAAASAGFDLLRAQPERVQRLRDNVRLYLDGLRRIGLTPPDTGTAIVPLLTRDEASTFTFAQRCRESGLFVTPIVYPAVPQNAPRIRTTITAALSAEDIAFAVETIAHHAPGLLR